MPEARKPNAKQMEAIEKTKGPVLITAGPGTGKTYTLVQRTLNLIKQGVEPENILITTFTRKAAGELITRITDETEKLGIPFNVKDMYIGTFHSLCGRLLRDNIEHTRLRPNFKILDEFEQQQLVLSKMGDFKTLPGTDRIIQVKRPALDLEDMWVDAGRICKFINSIEEEMVNVEELKKDEDPAIVECAEVVEEYRNILRENNMVDYSESQTECYRMLSEWLSEDSKAMEKLGIKYLMVDEYQDTNYIQEQLVLLLGGEDKNICVVGDDDQSLYRFRGATVSNILGFADNFPKEGTCEKAKTCAECKEAETCKKCTVISLEENYRSNDKIVEFYNKWMEDTDERREFGFYWQPDGDEPYRHLKNIVPQREKDKAEKAESVIKISGETEEEWRKNVLYFIQGLLKSGTIKDANQVAFLFESLKDKKVTALADYLEKHRMKVYAPRAEMFFERDEIKLAIGCLLLMFPEYKEYKEDDKEPRRRSKKIGIRKYYTECLEKVKDTEIAKFAAAQARHTDGLSYLDLIYRLFGQEPFCSMLSTNIAASATEIRPERNLALLTEIVSRFEFLCRDEKDAENKMRRFFEGYLRLVHKDGLREYEYEEEYAPKGCVSFLTFHQAKGMEYPIVFVGSLESNLKTAAEVEEKKKKDEEKRQKRLAEGKELSVPNPDMLRQIQRKGYYHGKKYEPYNMIKFFDLWRQYYTAFSRAQDLLVLTCSENYGEGKTSPSRLFEGAYNELPSGLPAGKEGKIDFSATNKTNLKKTFSYTAHIALYDRCPLLYKFRQEICFKSLRQDNTRETMLGTLVHETIEKIHKEVLAEAEFLMTDEAIEKWLRGNYEDLRTSDEFVELSEKDLEKALQQVLNYAHSMEGKWAVVDAEADIMLPEGNYIIEGIVDLIQQGTGDTLEIVDFKTSGKKPEIGDIFYDRYKKQLHVYAYLVEKRYGKKVSRMHLHYTSDDKEPLVTFEYNAEEVKATMDAFKKTAGKIIAKDFSGPVTLPELCGKCDFRFYCRK